MLLRGNSLISHKSEILLKRLRSLTSVRAVCRIRVLSVAKVLIDQGIIHENSNEYQKYRKTPTKDVYIMYMYHATMY